MKFYIITNNDGDLVEHLTKAHKDVIVNLVKGNIRDVAFEAREYLMGNYSLVADPVAGRLERPTPYLTIILKENNNTASSLPYEIMRVEHFVKMYNEHGKMLNGLPEKHKNDFQEIDKSLTLGCCMQMLMGR